MPINELKIGQQRRKTKYLGPELKRIGERCFMRMYTKIPNNLREDRKLNKRHLGA